MDDKDDKPPCKYGVKCYRRNEEHKQRYSHLQNDQSDEQHELNSNDTDQSRSNSPTEQASPSAKRRKTVSSHASDSDDDIDEILSKVKDPTEIETTSNGSKAASSAARCDENATTVANAKGTSLSNDRCSEFINKHFDKGPHAQHVEYQKLLESPAQFIRSKFLVEMPKDFFEFWSFCEANASANVKPENLFNKFGLSLVGPFDVLAKKFHDIGAFEPGDYLRHWRFYYDTPEFQVSTQNTVNTIIL